MATTSRTRHWYDYGISQEFLWTPQHKDWHSGIDLGVPWGTVVTAAFDGIVSFAGCKPWGGQVDVTGFWNGATYTATVLHLHEILIHSGAVVHRGDILGYSGGDERGPCPTQMRKKGKPGGYSNGPHVHFELTYGSKGPYHGGPPYKITKNSYTVSPHLLLNDLRGNVTEQLPPDRQKESYDTIESIFALPEATQTILDAIPGFEGLIYRLHEAETFPGWKSIDQVADQIGNTDEIQDINLNLPGISATIPLGIIEKFNPSRVAYWAVGNTFGNFKPAMVRGIYLIIGITLLLALFLAAANAILEQQLDTAEELTGAAMPIIEATA